MRQLIRTYAITGLHEITVTGYTFSKQDVRLILNETKASSAVTTEDLVASVLVSSTKKNNVVSVVNGVITLASTTANLTVGDDLTIEIDVDNVAKTSDVTAISNKIGTFTGLNTVASKLSDILTSIESVSVSDLKLQLFFGIEGTFEAEAVGGETTDNPVIDECKTRYAESFSGLLPTGFVMPNSVTIDGTTYTGTIS